MTDRNITHHTDTLLASIDQQRRALLARGMRDDHDTRTIGLLTAASSGLALLRRYAEHYDDKPAPTVIEYGTASPDRATQLAALPVGTVVIDGDGDAWQKHTIDRVSGPRVAWFCARPEDNLEYTDRDLAVVTPLTVLHNPEDSPR